MRLSYSQAARWDLKSIYRKSAEQFGLGQADLYRDGLLAALAFCAEHPRSVREAENLSRPVRVHPFKSHIIVFVILEEAILVVRILHGRQDLKRNL